MIYLENIQTEQVVLIPSHGLSDRSSLLLTLTSTISGERAYESEVSVTETDGYYRTAIELPAGLNDGEYRYSLSYEIETYASGLCQIGQYSRPIQQGEGGFTLKQAK